MQGHRVESRDQGAAEGRLPLLRRVVGVVFIFVPLFPVWPRGAVQASHELLIDNPRSETPGAEGPMEGKRLAVSLKGQNLVQQLKCKLLLCVRRGHQSYCRRERTLNFARLAKCSQALREHCGAYENDAPTKGRR